MVHTISLWMEHNRYYASKLGTFTVLHSYATRSDCNQQIVDCCFLSGSYFAKFGLRLQIYLGCEPWNATMEKIFHCSHSWDFGRLFDFWKTFLPHFAIPQSYLFSFTREFPFQYGFGPSTFGQVSCPKFQPDYLANFISLANFKCAAHLIFFVSSSTGHQSSIYHHYWFHFEKCQELYVLTACINRISV